MHPSNRFIGGLLLVAGTTIGAGMLALPIVTGFAGFFPSLVLLLLYWLFMAFTAQLMLEVNLWMAPHTNLLTMAHKTLGRGGKLFSWIIYLFLLYSLTTAYLAGGGTILIEMIEALTHWQIPAWVTPFPLLLLFGFAVYEGASSVDFVNRLLMFCLMSAYALMILFLTPYVQPALLTHANWAALWIPVSIVSISFGFHIIIPTLTDYLNRDVKQIRRVLILGSLIPLIVYISWEILTLGIIPLEGNLGLREGFEKGIDGASLLASILKNPTLALLARLFSLFAIITSFLGVSLSLRDFLADALHIEKSPKGRLMLYLLTFLPPLAIVLIDPRAFLNALEYAGAFGVVTLLGLLPVLMVWRGRYVQKREGPYRTPGGKWALAAALLVSLSVIALEIIIKLGYLKVSV